MSDNESRWRLDYGRWTKSPRACLGFYRAAVGVGWWIVFDWSVKDWRIGKSCNYYDGPNHAWCFGPFEIINSGAMWCDRCRA